MLKDLLAEIAQADYISKLSLARKLDLPVNLIEAGIEKLVMLGYLQEDLGLDPCELPCGKCPYASMCQQNPIKTMGVTTKGHKLMAGVQKLLD